MIGGGDAARALEYLCSSLGSRRRYAQRRQTNAPKRHRGARWRVPKIARRAHFAEYVNPPLVVTEIVCLGQRDVLRRGAAANDRRDHHGYGVGIRVTPWQDPAAADASGQTSRDKSDGHVAQPPLPFSARVMRTGATVKKGGRGDRGGACRSLASPRWRHGGAQNCHQGRRRQYAIGPGYAPED